MAIMDNNRRMKKNTYLVMADAEKCFDRLWLKDCLVHIHEAGMRGREVNLIQEMNKRAMIVVDTLAGQTEAIEVKEIMKQGTVFGPQLCCVNSVKVNKMSSKTVTCITPEIKLEAMVYVDDIIGAGEKEHIERVGRNLADMEKERNIRSITTTGRVITWS